MEDGASAWSGLGSSMALPSTIREEVNQLQIELRDLKLQVSRDLMELRESMASVATELSAVIEKHKSVLTRLEGLEVRAQGIGHSTPKDEFNAFAYVQLDELEGSESAYDDVSEEVQGDRLEDVEPVSSSEVSEEVLTDEDVAAIFYETIVSVIQEEGGVLNNNMHRKYPEGYENTKEVKGLVKKALEADEQISTHKIDKFRTLYYTTGEDPEEVYARIFG